MKRLSIAVTAAFFFVSDLSCMMTVRRNGGVQSPIVRIRRQTFETKKAIEFVNDFGNKSLCSASEGFFTLSENSAIKSLCMMNDNQKCFLAISMLPYDIKVYAVSLLFNGHRQTAKQYCDLPYRQMLKKNFELEKSMKQFPISLIGKGRPFHCNMEHYFHMKQDELSCLHSAFMGQPSEPAVLRGVISTIKRLEEEKIHQENFQFDELEKGVLVIPTKKDRFFRLITSFGFGQSRWGGELVLIMNLVRLARYGWASFFSDNFDRYMQESQSDTMKILCILGGMVLFQVLALDSLFCRNNPKIYKNLNELIDQKY